MTLQTALIVAGIVLLLLVVAYNQWQIRKARRPRALQPEDDLPPMREPVVSPVVKPEVSARLHEPLPEHRRAARYVVGFAAGCRRRGGRHGRELGRCRRSPGG